MRTKLFSILSAACLALTIVPAAHATLTSFKSFVGHVGVSTDGFGSTSNDGTISAQVPVGATVLGAYLYSATFGQSPTLGTVTLNGTAVNFDHVVTNDIPPSLPAYFRTGRSDVTSIVAPIINGGPGGIYNFNVTESLGNTDGEALVVVYSLDSLPQSSVGILDGGAALGGDTTSINFADPLDPTAPGFFAEMRIGDSFSCCGQKSVIKVNGTTITENAGNNDDGDAVANGALITVGGFDDPFSPLNPGYDEDHERYNLVPQITKGDTSISVFTQNPSNDDNIFLAVFAVSGNAGFNEPPPTEQPPAAVPEPGTLFLLGSGFAVLAWWKQKQA